MDIKLIIFDFDGTLADTRRTIVKTLQMTMEQLHLPVASEAACVATIGLPLIEAFRILCPNTPEGTEKQCTLIYSDIFEKNKKILVPELFPHVADTIRYLSEKGLTLTVASSRNSPSLNDFIRELHLDSICYVLGADNVAHAKPHPEPVLKTLRDLHFKPEETLVVGDMPLDINMGASAGAATCGVTYGNATRQQLVEAKADWVIDDFAELALVIDGLLKN